MGLLPAVTYMDLVGEGTINADGNEQCVIDKEDNPDPFTLCAWLDLSNMEMGDTLIVKEYVKLKRNSTMVKYDQQSYSGVQENPALFITTKPAVYGLKITLKQLAAPFKSFNYNVIRQQSAIDKGSIVVTS